jgi:electron transfer flavoprotein beta subunit
MLAEWLDRDCIALATAIRIENGQAMVTREAEGGEETCTAALPLVITCQKGVAEARIPNMRGIMAARTRPLKVVTPGSFTEKTQISHYEMPPAKAGVKMIAPDQMDELVQLLHNEAKVI